MNIKLITVGKIKESYHTEAIDEYLKRLGAYCKLSIIEVSPSKILSELSSDIDKYKKEEGEKILSFIKKESFVITLEINAKQLSSEEFAERIDNLSKEGLSELVFVIGGANGLDLSVLERSDFSLSFSKMTFTHQMIRIVLLEQLYRAFKILKNEPYHR